MRMKVALCATESVPFVKTGGLADVIGGLSKALRKAHIDCRVVLPFFKKEFLKPPKKKARVKLIHDSVNQTLGNTEIFFDIYYTEYNRTPFYFIKNDDLFNRKHVYGPPRRDYKDNALRFCFFSASILNALEQINFVPDIIHLNDYHCGLTPVFLDYYKNSRYPEAEFFKNSRTVFTIHNPAYQGIYEKDALEFDDFINRYYSMDRLEYHGKINFMKGGILYSDKVTTVSPAYSKEILIFPNGHGLEGVLNKRKEDMSGIINGVDYDIWDPNLNPARELRYSAGKMAGKGNCKKKAIEKYLGADTVQGDKPLISMISRLASQKGIDLLIDFIQKSWKKDFGYFIFLGKGDEHYEKRISALNNLSENISINIDYSDELAKEIFSGTDIFLMPSIYEPCGISQLIALKYGAIPVVNDTGGLSDTVRAVGSKKDILSGGTGFKFYEYTAKGFEGALRAALHYFKKKELWKTLVENSMRQDYSWEYSANEYHKLYSSIIKE